MSDFFAKLGMLSDKKLDWKCSNCKRKFRAKCNAASHIAQSSCKRMSATVLFIGVANELLRAQYANLKKCPPVGILRWTILDGPPRTSK